MRKLTIGLSIAALAAAGIALTSGSAQAGTVVSCDLVTTITAAPSSPQEVAAGTSINAAFSASTELQWQYNGAHGAMPIPVDHYRFTATDAHGGNPLKLNAITFALYAGTYTVTAEPRKMTLPPVISVEGQDIDMPICGDGIGTTVYVVTNPPVPTPTETVPGPTVTESVPGPTVTETATAEPAVVVGSPSFTG